MLTPYAIDLFWVGVGAAVLAVLYLIGREILGARLARRRRDAVRHAPVDWRPESWKARALLEPIASRRAGSMTRRRGCCFGAA